MTQKRPLETEKPAKDEVDVEEMHLGFLSEHHEPIEGREPMPWWFPTLMVLLLFWGGYYVGRYGGRFDANSYDPVSIGGTGGGAGTQPAGTQTERGEAVYRSICVSCHQPNALGVPNQYPPLAQSEWVNGPSAVPIKIVLRGLSGPVSVKGAQFNGQMPAWAASLSDDQIADVLTFVRASFGNKAGPIRSDEVKSLRDQTQSRTAPWTVSELQASAPAK